jgi:hypothetical protein
MTSSWGPTRSETPECRGVVGLSIDVVCKMRGQWPSHGGRIIKQTRSVLNDRTTLRQISQLSGKFARSTSVDSVSGAAATSVEAARSAELAPKSGKDVQARSSHVTGPQFRGLFVSDRTRWDGRGSFRQYSGGHQSGHHPPDLSSLRRHQPARVEIGRDRRGVTLRSGQCHVSRLGARDKQRCATGRHDRSPDARERRAAATPAPDIRPGCQTWRCRTRGPASRETSAARSCRHRSSPL